VDRLLAERSLQFYVDNKKIMPDMVVSHLLEPPMTITFRRLQEYLNGIACTHLRVASRIYFLPSVSYFTYRPTTLVK